MTTSKRLPDEPGFDVFAVPPRHSRTLLHETAAGPAGAYEIAIFELRSDSNVMWVVRKRTLFTVENSKAYSPGWTSELYFNQTDLESMGRAMLGNVLGRVTGESLRVSAVRDQVMMELRTQLKEHMSIVTNSRDNAHLHENICALQVNAEADDDGDYQCFLSTLRMMAGFIQSVMEERESE